MNISIKNVKEERWMAIKSEAVRNNMKIGEFLNKLFLEYKNKENKNGNWNEILYGKKYLTDRDAIKIKEAMKETRKEFEFR